MVFWFPFRMPLDTNRKSGIFFESNPLNQAIGRHSLDFGSQEHKRALFEFLRQDLFLWNGVNDLAKRNRFLQLSTVTRPMLKKVMLSVMPLERPRQTEKTSLKSGYRRS